jgi:K+-transporting ATPase KdpF subunit
MMDVVSVGLVRAFFGLSWALVKLCEHIKERRMTWRYLPGGIAAVGLVIYLVVPLLKPEVFS